MSRRQSQKYIHNLGGWMVDGHFTTYAVYAGACRKVGLLGTFWRTVRQIDQIGGNRFTSQFEVHQ